MNNLFTRSLTGLVFAALIIVAVLLGKTTFAALFFVINLFALAEFYRLVSRRPDTGTILPVGLTAGSIVFILISLVSLELAGNRWLLLILLVPVMVTVFFIYKKNTAPASAIAIILSGIICITIPFAILGFLYNPAFFPGVAHPEILLGFFIIIWSYDSFAYLTGMLFGKHKLFERHSPKKTWEGTIGGSVFALLAGWILFSVYGVFDLGTWLGMGALIIVFGTLGDLAESMLKRNFNVKDSGNSLPGHGGLLDRFDAVLMASPVIFVYLAFVA